MPATLSPQAFVAKWRSSTLKESAAAQEHFIDLCRLLAHPTPAEFDPTGDHFTFEKGATKQSGGQGWADVWYQGRFAWEYKGKHANLDKAYQQLLLYRESLGNPPLLITSDMQRILIHTNFTNTVKQVHEIDFARLQSSDGLALLRAAFADTAVLEAAFKPAQTQAQVTRATADTFVGVVNTLQKWSDAEGKLHDPERLAHFVIRLLFCLFAEDMELLPGRVFTRLIERQGQHYYRFVDSLRALFAAMRDGGPFGVEHVPHFNGTLFDDAFVPELPSDIIDQLLKAARQDWSAVDPSIFGTLFERVIDQSKRAQLGAHYTSKDDIMLIVEPVLMRPLRDEWQQVKFGVGALADPAAQRDRLEQFAGKIAATRVLDPACGSGNFLYVALQQLLDLQKEVITLAARHGLDPIPLTVSPAQLYGIEINPYAHELAQITVWIGYLQWRKENGFADFDEPILRPLHNIQHRDAILAYDDDGRPVEPAWPAAEVIIGNPPFLGWFKLRQELSDAYVSSLFKLYEDRVPGGADLVCYWFEKARRQIENQTATRVGLLATNSIRGGANRKVLDRIKETGEIFMAWDDRSWILDGAAVRVSIIGFDDASETMRVLNGKSVPQIQSDLTTGVDLTIAKRLTENVNVCFLGAFKFGAFDIPHELAVKMLDSSDNPNGRPNSDVVRPWVNGLDITRRPRGMWLINFGTKSEEEAAQYRKPFEYVLKNVKPERDKNRRDRRRIYWWQHGETSPGLYEALNPLPRYIGSPRVAKYRLFVWLSNPTIPDMQVIVFARSDDYFFGVLHSKPHELWALRLGTWLGKGNDPRYTPTTTFETFPFPWPPGTEPAEADDPRVLAIAQAARRLDALRQAWLHPPAADIGVVIAERVVRQRTLTNLYNALTRYRQAYKGRQRDVGRWQKEAGGIISLDEIEELDYVHGMLDAAVTAAYGWPATLSDEQILERLLALNLARATL